MKVLVLMTSLLLSPGMIQAGYQKPLLLEEEHLYRPVVITGVSGGGKSKLIESICRQMLDQDQPFTYFDPHDDTAESLVEALMVKKVDPSRINLLEFGREGCVSFDPYYCVPDASDPTFRMQLKAVCDRIIDACLRNVSVGDQEGMKRLRRWMRRILFGCGVKVDGKHLGLDKALVFTDPQRKEFGEYMDLVGPYLPPEYASDFEKLRQTKRPIDQERWLESSINGLDDVLGPVVKLVTGQHATSYNPRETILQRKFTIVKLRKTKFLSRRERNVIGGLLVNFGIDAAEQLAEELPPEKRLLHPTIIDEAENFGVGEDTRMGAAELRKFRNPHFLGFQDLNCLLKGDIDAISKFFGNAGMVISFAQGDVETIEYLGKVFALGSYDFTPLVQMQVMPDGYFLIPSTTVSLSVQEGMSRSEAESLSVSETRTHQHHTSETYQEAVSHALSRTHSEGTTHAEKEEESEGWNEGSNWSKGKTSGKTTTEGGSETQSNSKSRQRGRTSNTSSSSANSISNGNTDGGSNQRGDSSSHVIGETKRTLGRNQSHSDNHSTSRSATSTHTSASASGTSETEGETQGHSTGKNWSVALAESESESVGGSSGRSGSRSRGVVRGATSTDAEGTTDTQSSSKGKTEGVSDGASHGEVRGNTVQNGMSVNTGSSVTLGMTPLAAQRIIEVPTGNLLRSVNDQLAWVMNKLASLPDRYALVKCRGMGVPFLLKIHDVTDPYDLVGMGWATKEWRAADMKQFLAKVKEAQGCWFDPVQVIEELPEFAAVREMPDQTQSSKIEESPML